MGVVTAIDDVGPCRKALTIEVPLPAVTAETDRVLGDYRRQARIPGFRKGKAPEGLVRKRFGQEIRQEVIDRLVPRYWHQAEAEEELDPLRPPSLESVEFELGESLTFRAVVEVRPDFEIGELEGFDLPDPPTEPTEAELEQELNRLRRRTGTWTEVDRGAARGDLVLVEIDKGDEETDRLTFEVGDDQVWEELSLAVTGLSAGQQSTFRRPPAEGEDPVEYRVSVEKVEEIELPPLDDEFAAEVGDFDSRGELEETLTGMIRRAKRREARRQREKALLEQLRERYPTSLPEGLVHDQAESMVRDYAHELAHQGVDLESADIDWGQLGARMVPEAEKSVHSRLILDAIAEEREIEVPEERLEAVLAQIAGSRDTTPLAVRRELDRSGRLAELRGRLRREAVVSELLGEEPAEVESASEEAPPDVAVSAAHNEEPEQEPDGEGESEAESPVSAAPEEDSEEARS